MNQLPESNGKDFRNDHKHTPPRRSQGVSASGYIVSVFVCKRCGKNMAPTQISDTPVAKPVSVNYAGIYGKRFAHLGLS